MNDDTPIKEVTKIPLDEAHTLVLQYSANARIIDIKDAMKQLQEATGAKVIAISDDVNILGTISNTDVALLKLRGDIQ